MDLTLYRYTPSEVKELLQNIIVLVDTREQRNDHIISYFKSKSIAYKESKLFCGDYSFGLPKYESLGIPREIWFDNRFVIERKGSLEELSGNFSQDRDRFTSEFMRAKDANKDIQIHILAEGASFDDIVGHKYKTAMNEKAFIASLMTFQHRFNTSIGYCSKENAGMYIYGQFYYYLKEWLPK